MGLSHNRVSEIIGNANFGNIDNLLSQGHDMEYIARHYSMDLALARPPRLSGQSNSVEASRSDCYCFALPGRCLAGSRWRAGLGFAFGRKD